MALVKAALRIIAAAKPRFWVIENVRGAIPWLKPILGPPVQSHGPFFLWGVFPPFYAAVTPFKEKLSSAQRAERARVPAVISGGLVAAVEAAGELIEIYAKLRAA